MLLFFLFSANSFPSFLVPNFLFLSLMSLLLFDILEEFDFSSPAEFFSALVSSLSTEERALLIQELAARRPRRVPAVQTPMSESLRRFSSTAQVIPRSTFRTIFNAVLPIQDLMILRSIGLGVSGTSTSFDDVNLSLGVGIHPEALKEFLKPRNGSSIVAATVHNFTMYHVACLPACLIRLVDERLDRAIARGSETTVNTILRCYRNLKRAFEQVPLEILVNSKKLVLSWFRVNEVFVWDLQPPVLTNSDVNFAFLESFFNDLAQNHPSATPDPQSQPPMFHMVSPPLPNFAAFAISPPSLELRSSPPQTFLDFDPSSVGLVDLNSSALEIDELISFIMNSSPCTSAQENVGANTELPITATDSPNWDCFLQNNEDN